MSIAQVLWLYDCLICTSYDGDMKKVRTFDEED